MTERPKLTSLSDRLARKVSSPAAEPAAAPAPDAPAKAGKADERVQIIVRMTVAERKALRQIALDKDTTAQALAEEAIRDVLRRHGHSD
ncbi:ribbon-helix-helix domain-containing protein [Methylobacterium aerolatum]|uniref:Antitoxin-like ribbon-helix-helix domain-containing protein n=1 Tax=Methylobacterium aerolatum TaxID=418708 RepID=A0ABU0I8R2_9HYPH|nr:ribbon-helix-helix domain-containing protein [Methylobacterium aerolatum]MDQ0450029.1 hypothetical protein [Methylobacterium aerolatum]